MENRFHNQMITMIIVMVKVLPLLLLLLVAIKAGPWWNNDMVNDWSFRNDAFRGPDIPYKSIPNCVDQSPLAQLYIQGTITNIVQRKVHLTVVLYDDLIPNTDDIDDIKYRYDDRGTSYHLCHGGRDCCHESWDIMTHHHHYIFGRDLPHMKCFRGWIIS